MNTKILFFIFFSSAVFSFHGAAAAAFNVTAVLATRPSFSTFNDFLSRTGVADTINSRPPPVTVLAVANGNISTAAPEVLKKIVSVHVLLGYYDAETLRTLGNTSVTVTTLFQASGQAANNQGSINITGLGSGSVGFRSVGDTGGGAAAPAAASLVAPVVAQPYNFSVLQISNVIVPPGIENNSTNTNSNSAPATSPITPPSPSPLTPPSSSPTNPPASPTTPPSASPTKPPASSPTKPPAASPTTPPATSPIRPPAASPTKPPSPSPRKMISPSPAPSTAPSASPESAPTPTAPAADDESSSNSAGVGIVAIYYGRRKELMRSNNKERATSCGDKESVADGRCRWDEGTR
ncbi:hypothetical protein DM860_010218 [Cuscuta australis]|uniref:FAS1 domain-containing protein n=1 Tax=Cuscuta australis TaxID=267555 RepID=A0A328D7K9_9ASTE|nr:hypothetical protein DM860_010218 [Cuscuta australis]